MSQLQLTSSNPLNVYCSFITHTFRVSKINASKSDHIGTWLLILKILHCWYIPSFWIHHKWFVLEFSDLNYAFIVCISRGVPSLSHRVLIWNPTWSKWRPHQGNQIIAMSQPRIPEIPVLDTNSTWFLAWLLSMVLHHERCTRAAIWHPNDYHNNPPIFIIGCLTMRIKNGRFDGMPGLLPIQR